MTKFINAAYFASRPSRAYVCDGQLILQMPTGLEMRFPVAHNPRLANGDARALNHIEISRTGLHWPDLDEDLSFAGLAQGNYGQKNFP